MKRRHLRQDVIDVCKRARDLRPDMVFGADIIAGFPTETDAMFENTRALVEECDLTYLHVFPYSERDGTPAAKMPPVYPPTRKKRAKILRDLGDQIVIKRLDEYVGQEANVLIEKNNMGHSEHFLPVTFKETLAQGTLVRAKLVSHDGQKMAAVKI